MASNEILNSPRDLLRTVCAVGGSYLLPAVLGALLLHMPPCQVGQPDTPAWSLPAAGAIHYSQAFLTATSAVTCAGLGGHGLDRLSPIGLVVVMLLVQYGALITIGWSTWLMFHWLGSDAGTHSVPRLRATVGLAAAFLIPIELLGTGLLWMASDPATPWLTRITWSTFHALGAAAQTGFSPGPTAGGDLAVTWALPLVIGPLVFVSGLGLPVWLVLRHHLTAGRRRPDQPSDPRIVTLSRHASTAGILSLGLLLAGTVTMTACLALRPTGGTTSTEAVVRSFADGGVMAMTARSSGVAPRRGDQIGHAASTVLLVLAITGACPGSAGGGVKATNCLLVLAFAWCRWRRRPGPTPAATAAALLLAWVAVATAVTMVVLLRIEPLTWRDALFESARATTHTAIPSPLADALSPAGKSLLAGTMLLGRVVPFGLLAIVTTRHRDAIDRYRPGPLPGP